MIEEKVLSIVAAQFDSYQGEINLNTDLMGDLQADSLDIVELTMAMEDEFELPEVGEEELKKIRTVGDLVNYIAGVIGR